MEIKGVVLAGGLGTRLYPLTKVTNKHLLPVYDKPMVFYPIEKLVEAGIEDILLVTGGNNAGDFLRLIGNGKIVGVKRMHYTYQEGEGGIADALRLAEDFCKNSKIVVILGDNIFKESLRPYMERFLNQKRGARIILKKVDNPEKFGVPVIEDGKIKKIVEKPEVPPSSYAVTGIYMYDYRVFSFIKELKPSKRGEYEISDVNNRYIEIGEMEYDIMEGWWLDAGSSFENYYKAISLIRKERGYENPPV